MKRLFLVVGTAVVILPSLAAARAQAEDIQWSEAVTQLGPHSSLFLDNPGAFLFSQNIPSNAYIAMAPGFSIGGTNSESVVLAHLTPVGDSSSFVPARFGGPSDNYSLSLALRDDASGASGSLTFRGNLSGFVVFGNGATADLTNTFLGPTSQTLKLGQNLYTVTIGPFVPPVPTDPPPASLSEWSGSLSASIAVRPTVNSTPEPSSLVLACLGLPLLGLAGWVRRRKVVDSNASNAETA